MGPINFKLNFFLRISRLDPSLTYVSLINVLKLGVFENWELEWV